MIIKIRQTLCKTDTKTLEAWLAILFIIWGGYFIYPGGAFKTGLVYVNMAKIASEVWWGTVQVSIGVGNIIGIALDNPRIRQAFSFMLMLYAGYMAGTFVFANFHSLAFPTQLYICVSSVWVFSRIPTRKDTPPNAGT